MEQKSFTLIEILVVIVIIGIISAFIIVSMAGVSDKARIAKGQAFSNSLRNSLLLDLVSEWTFDTGTTSSGELATSEDLKDVWGSANGSPYGSAITIRDGSNCVKGKCIDLDPIDSSTLSRIDSITMSNKNNLSFTISSWVYFRDGKRWNGGVFSENAAGPIFYINSSLGVILYYNNHPTYAGLSVFFSDSTSQSCNLYFPNDITNKWTNEVLVVKNREDVKLYINGVPSTSSCSISSQDLRQSNVWLSNIGNYTTYWLNGRIDDIKIFNEAFSQTKIESVYFSSLNDLLINNKINFFDYNQRIVGLREFLVEKN
ncbi:MAG: LamG-like jellyroll fold domain-containing protein [Candidatus Paceibacterota bacterium]|jgi:prepilin-type N-terminal cleavage/methylation domain-containing protein